MTDKVDENVKPNQGKEKSEKSKKTSGGETTAGHLPLKWQKLDILIGKVGLGLLTAILALWINRGQVETNQRIAETTREMEKLKTELVTRRMDAQLANNMTQSLLEGSETERLAAMVILEHSLSAELSETIFAVMAVQDPNTKVRGEAIKILEKKGNSLFIKHLLQLIKEQSSSKIERDAAETARGVVEQRIRTNLDQLLASANAYYKNGLYKSTVKIFQSDELQQLVTVQDLDQAELALARTNYELKNYKTSSEHYLTAYKKLHRN